MSTGGLWPEAGEVHEWYRPKTPVGERGRIFGSEQIPDYRHGSGNGPAGQWEEAVATL